MESAKRVSVCSLAVLLSCAGPDDEPLGEEVWTANGGRRDPCEFRALYRSGMRVEHREYQNCELLVSQKGKLTDEGLAEYIAASAELSPGQELPSCLPLDGIDATALAFDGTNTFEVRYCVSAEDHAAARLEGFFSALRTGLEACKSHKWFAAC